MAGLTPPRVFCGKSEEAIDGKGLRVALRRKRVRNCMRARDLCENTTLEESRRAGRTTIAVNSAQTCLRQDSRTLISYFCLLVKYVQKYYLSRWKIKG